MKPLFIVPGPIEWATSRFRAYWLAPFFEDSDVIPYEYVEKNAGMVHSHIVGHGFTHLIWLKFAHAAFMQWITQPSIWDVTDPMWWFGDYREVEKTVRGITCSSPGLREDFRMWKRSATPNPVHLPDTLSLDHYGDPRQKHEGEAKKLIWYGHHNNRMTLFGAMTNLLRLWEAGHRFELTIFDDAGDKMIMFNPPFQINRIMFNLEREPEILKEHDLAILPPYPGPWGSCKSNNKVLTAGACGLAYVTGLHYRDLEIKLIDPDDRNRQAKDWRSVVEERYTSKHGADNLREYLEILS